MSEGFVSSGWKDTVLVTPGVRVRIVKPFGDFKGAFMYHCHNLEHEDMDRCANSSWSSGRRANIIDPAQLTNSVARQSNERLIR